MNLAAYFWLSLILLISPYASGHDFGSIKIPNFKDTSKTKLKFFGPVIFVIAIALHLPLLPETPVSGAEVPISEPGAEEPMPEPEKRIAEKCTEAIYETVTDANACGTYEQEFIISPAKVNTCRHKAFGIEKWSSVATTSGNSGWMRGGRSQPDWCNSLAAGYISGHGIGAEHKTKVVSSNEDARWTGNFNRTREYNYSCTVEISWSPIYKPKTDAATCGTTPAKTGKRNVAATCAVKTGEREIECGA